jgi:hypothetical protein
MTTPKQWLTYWKISLSDASKADINIDKLPRTEISDFNIESKFIADLVKVNKVLDEAEKRKNHKNGITDRNGENWVPLNETEVLVAPFWLMTRTDHRIRPIDFNPKYPFWFYVRLNRLGKLDVPEETFPVFQRKYLEPLADEADFVLSSMERIDQAAAFSRSEFNGYTEYIQFVQDIFFKVSDQPFDQYETEGLERVPHAMLVVPDEDTNAAISIIRLYENILSLKELPTLLKTLIQPTVATTAIPPLSVPKLLKANAWHVGQMGFEFGLFISQRKALYSFLTASEDQKVFAVNGPPGTGKTTLLQSIVANAYVQAALSGEDAPVILACSTNNQAVTNIIESFSKTNTLAGSLHGRWLPDVTGYATYLPSSSKTQSELSKINYKKLDGEGLFKQVENTDYLLRAKAFYKLQSEKHFGVQSISIEDSVNHLQREIRTVEDALKEAEQRWSNYKEAERKLQSLYASFEAGKVRYYSGDLVNDEELEKDIVGFQELEQRVIQYFTHEPLLRRIGCFFTIRASLENRASELRIVFRNSLLPNPPHFKRNDILKTIDEQICLASAVVGTLKEWKRWKERNAIKGNPPSTEEAYWQSEMIKMRNETRPNCFYDELDVTLRHRAFQLALHYWEGRYLLKLTDDLETDPFAKKKNEIHSWNRWKRHAMLTPCFVSTFYMAPKFFSWSKYLRDNDKGQPLFESPPLLEIADLLIVDEAGQVSPEVGVATFALAKKAIVVGDIKQIEPVWNVTAKVDMGNLRQSGLIDSYKDTRPETEFNPKGFLSSTGSLMQMAQNACNIKEPKLQEKGFLLMEHKRCYDEIIAYCNDLAYGQLLKPLRGAAKGNLFPPMCAIHVEGNSTTTQVGSRRNDAEVKAIVNWLQTNKLKIEEKHGKLEMCVGIITPFVGQKSALQYALRTAGFDVGKMKIGTVHALQGAERPIVLFSMVYGPGDSGTLFFDRDNKPNMLNVAVSRAKDNFIVFCNSGILNKAARTPSGILANYLKFES